MSVRKRQWGDGKEAWQVDLLVKGKRHRQQFTTKREATAYEAEIKTQARAGTFRADGMKTSVADVVPAFFEELEKRNVRGKSMTRSHMQHVKAHINNYVIGGVPIQKGTKTKVFKHGIGSCRLPELTTRSVEEFLDCAIDSGITAKTAKQIRNSLLLLLEFARGKNLVAINVARGIRILATRNSKSKAKIKPPPRALIREMIARADPDFKVYLMFAVLTGVRAGEQRGLRWSHIDLGHRMVTIQTRVDRWGDEDDQGAKTDAGNRDIPLAPDLVGVLHDWRSRTPFPSEDDFVFPSRSGTPKSHNSIVTWRFRPLYAAVVANWPSGQPKPPLPRWHDLRHFAVSTWIQAKWSPKEIQEFAGHASLSTTMDIYGHLFEPEDYSDKMAAIAGTLLM